MQMMNNDPFDAHCHEGFPSRAKQSVCPAQAKPARDQADYGTEDGGTVPADKHAGSGSAKDQGQRDQVGMERRLHHGTIRYADAYRIANASTDAVAQSLGRLAFAVAKTAASRLFATSTTGSTVDSQPDMVAIHPRNDRFALGHFRRGSRPSAKRRSAAAGISPMTISW
jgi:hypothetical protein